ncbi:MAG: hypothetical protein M3R15_17045 [Acidobacteriota bacterium]|nr:hypothetical protein [Acidobacteriota bacterium]
MNVNNLHQEDSTEQLFVRYLLGELTEDEQSSFEGRHFNDPHSVELLEVVRDDLIDAYLDDQLSPHDRERFENYFLASPHHAQKLAFAESFKNVLSDAPHAEVASSNMPAQHSWWPSLPNFTRTRLSFTAMAAAVLLVAVGGFLLLRVVRQPHDPIVREESMANDADIKNPNPDQSSEENNSNADQPNPNQNLRPESRNTSQLAEQSEPRPRTQTITFLLTAGVRGIEEAKPLVMTKDTKSVQLLVDRPAGEYESYLVSLGTVEGEEIWSRKIRRLRPAKSGQNIMLTVPADLLANRDYLLRINGVDLKGELEAVSQYYFRVVK